MELVRCKNLTKTYGTKKVLDGVDLTVGSGKIIGLLGKNGAGKSTLIKLINDLLTPTFGTVEVLGKPIGIESKRIISYLPERTYLDKSMTVEKVLGYFKGFYSDFDESKARELLQRLNLDTGEQISKMSKGMQEKLQLVLVMSRKAQLYILDEPLGGVDPATRDYVLDTIISNYSEGASVIISTHLVSDIERVLDEVIFLDGGKVVLHSDCEQLRAEENASIDEIFRRKFKC